MDRRLLAEHRIRNRDGAHVRRHGPDLLAVPAVTAILRSSERKMRREVVLLAAMTLGGCLPDQTEDVAGCQKEADRFYQGYQDVDTENPRSRYVIECMTARGYDFDVLPADCVSSRPFPTQPACYVPRNWLARIIDRYRAR